MMSNAFDSKLNENIGNAYEVVRKTYESMKKLFAALDAKADEEGFISLVNYAPNFLRWRSDLEPSGWLIGSAIKLYQRKTDPGLEGIWRDGAIYLIEIQLENEKQKKLFGPEVITAQFTFEDMPEAFTRPLGMGDHSAFYHPLRKAVEFPGEQLIFTHQLDNPDPGNKHLRSIHYRRRPLAYISQENFAKLIDDFKDFGKKGRS